MNHDQPKPVQDVPVAEAKAEERKMEWGPELGKMNWVEAKKEVEKLNEGLEVGEMLWRLPVQDELRKEFKKTGSTPAGFERDKYWTCIDDTDYPNQAYYIDMSDGSGTCIGKYSNSFYVRPIRPVAPHAPNYQI